MQILPHTFGCFVCGIRNPHGLRLDLLSDSRVVESRFQFRPEHCGFRGTVHGGLIATVLDEAMAWVIGVHARRFAYCAELNTRFLAPAAPGVDLVARAEVVEDKRGKLYVTRSELRDAAGTVLTEATGKYLALPIAKQAEFLADFAEDASGWILFGTEPTAGAEKGKAGAQINKS